MLTPRLLFLILLFPTVALAQPAADVCQRIHKKGFVTQLVPADQYAQVGIARPELKKAVDAGTLTAEQAGEYNLCVSETFARCMPDDLKSRWDEMGNAVRQAGADLSGLESAAAQLKSDVEVFLTNSENRCARRMDIKPIHIDSFFQ